VATLDLRRIEKTIENAPLRRTSSFVESTYIHLKYVVWSIVKSGSKIRRGCSHVIVSLNPIGRCGARWEAKARFPNTD
jgi:hypothetical protein